MFAEEGKLFPPLRSSSERNGSVSADELLVSHPNARVDLVESFNQLHASLALSRPDQEIRVVVVTSPLPSEGKTLTTANLALTLAGRGERVLLIDGDLRCGHLHEIFPGPRSPGFAELLAGSASLNEVARPIRVPGTGELMVISAGAVVASPGRLLSLDRLRKIIDATSQPFDYVLIDSPPINLLADASLLGAAADAVLLVIRAGRSRMDEVGYAIDQLAVAHAPLIGTLLTDVDPANNGYDDDAYRYLAGASEYVASHRPVIEG